MSKHRDTLDLLAEARPARLTPGHSPADPVALMTYPRPGDRPARTRGLGRRSILAGAGFAAVAAVAAAVVLRPEASVPHDATASPGKTAVPGHTVTKEPTTASGLLLVAAEHTATSPAESGRYWVVRAVHGQKQGSVTNSFTDEQWLATRTGDPSVAFVQDPAGGWSRRPLEGHTPANNFLLAGQTRSIAQLDALPTRPDQLKAKLLDWYGDTGRLEGDEKSFLFYSGLAIVLDLPVPTAVRAAAYRMLAALPGVASLGPVTDSLGRTGIAVAVTRRGDAGTEMQTRLIVDPATGRALAQQTRGGQTATDTTIESAHWSDSPLPNAAELR